MVLYEIEELIRQQQAANDFLIRPIELSHVLALNGLPLHHKDPFDRLLIAQAQVEDAALVSNDSVFQHYQVTMNSKSILIQRGCRKRSPGMVCGRVEGGNVKIASRNVRFDFY